jgi:murein DD-endopeptidase MepM/ murein hydrolase activator NlpD
MRWSARHVAGAVALVLVAAAISPTGAHTRVPRSNRVMGKPAIARSAIRPEAAAHASLGTLRARRPVQGKVTSGFGPRRAFWGRRFHTGIDLSARHGTPVRSPAAGTVVFAGRRSGYGKTIVVDHGNRLHTVYAHLSGYSVRPGQPVRAGTALGRIGSTGRASGPHLHYEILSNGRAVDPRLDGPRQSHSRRERLTLKQLPRTQDLGESSIRGRSR